MNVPCLSTPNTARSLGLAAIVLALSGCSSTDSYYAGRALDSTLGAVTPLRGVVGVVTAPMKMEYQDEKRRQAELDNQRRQAEEQRRKEEDARWLNGLSPELREKVLASRQQTQEQKVRHTQENTEGVGNVIHEWMKPDVVIYK